MIKFPALLAGLTSGFARAFAPQSSAVNGDNPSTEVDRYLYLYRNNRSVPYFNEADEESGDGLILHH